MQIRQQPFGHRHRQERNAAGLYKLANHAVGLCIRRALAQHDQRSLRVGEHAQGAIDRLRCGQLAGSRVDDPPDCVGSGRCLHGLAQHVARDVEVDPARPAGNRGANSACDAAPDVLDPADPVRRLRERPCGVQLVELAVLAALQIDHRSIARARDLDHRKAIRRGVGEGGQAVQEAGCRHRQAHAGPPGEESGSGRGVARRGLLAKTDVADPRRLRDAGEVGDRDADDPVDGVDVVGLEGVHDEVKAVGQTGRNRAHVPTPRVRVCVCSPLWPGRPAGVQDRATM